MLRTEIYNRDDHSVKARISIGQKSGRFIETQSGIDLYEDGVRVRKGGVMFIPDSKGRPKRGKITGWSAASRRRLRQLFLEAALAVPFERFSVTLTCPWCVKDWQGEEIGKEWRAAVHAFSIAFERRFPGCVLIYRTELQQRKAPHMHGVIYAPRGFVVPSKVRIPPNLAHQFFYLELRRLWGGRSVMGRIPWTENAGPKGGFNRRGVDFDPIEDAGAFLRYVADHASKRKQAQLGWKGRQWGIIGRKHLVRREGRPLAVAEWKQLVFLRYLRRICRYRVKAACNFGTKLSHKNGASVKYVNASNQARLLRFIDDMEADRFQAGKEARPEQLVSAELLGSNVGLLE